MTALIVFAFLCAGLGGEYLLEWASAAWTSAYFAILVAALLTLGPLAYPRGSEILGTAPWWGLLACLECAVLAGWGIVYAFGDR